MTAPFRTRIVSILGVAVLLAACGSQNIDALLKSARAYLAQNDGKAAVIQLKNVLRQQPDSAEARFLLGKALLEIGDVASASVELRRAFDLKHPATEVLPVLARALVTERQYRRLIDEFGQVDLADRAAVADLKTSIATAHAGVGDPGQAQAAIAAALRAVPDYPATLLLQARLAMDERRFDAAAALIDKVIVASPQNAQAWHSRGDLLVLRSRELGGAEAAYRKALTLQPGHTGSRSNLITLLLASRDLPGATEQVGELRKSLPNHPQTIFFESQLAFFNRDRKKASELIQQVLKVAPDDVKVLQFAGAVEFGNGALLEAERTLNKALSLEPNLPFARRQLAQTYLRLNQPSKALTALAPLMAGPDATAQAHSIAAEAYLLAGDAAQAETHYAKAINLDPGNSRNRTALALTKSKSSGPDATLAELEDIASADKEIHAEMALVSMHIRTKDFQRALKAIDAIEAKQPDRPTASNLRGRVHLLRNDVSQARSSFERALAVDPVYVPAATSLAALDLADKKPEAAKKRFEAVLAIDPKNLQALMAVAELQIREGRPKKEVVSILNAVIKLNPTERAPRLMLIDHHLYHKEYKEALLAAQDAEAAVPSSAELLDALGRAQAAAGDTNQAVTTFGKLASIEPRSAQAHMRLAGVHLAAKNTAAAEQSLRRVLAITPKSLPAQRALIDIALAENRPADALLVARAVQKQQPEAVTGWLLEGAIEVSRKNVPAAAEVYRSALKKFPQTDLATKLHSLLIVSGQTASADRLAASWGTDHPQDLAFTSYLGELELARNNLDAAEAHFQKVIALRPDTAAALNNLAWIMLKRHKPGALPYAEKADRLQPNTPVLMDTLAAALALDKQLPKAIDIQKKALALAPDNHAFQLHLARLHIQAGNKAAARIELETLARLGERFAGQAEVSQLLKAL